MEENQVKATIENAEMVLAHLKLEVENNLKIISVLEQFIKDIQTKRLWG